MGLIILLGILYLALCLLAAMPAYKKARGIYFNFCSCLCRAYSLIRICFGVSFYKQWMQEYL